MSRKFASAVSATWKTSASGGRPMMNVVGNCLASVVIAKWEGEFVEASDEELSLAAARGEI